MADEVSDINRISEIISDVLSAYTESVRIVVGEVSSQLTQFAMPVSSAILFTIVDLIDNILDLYPEEWIFVQQSIRRLTGWIENLIVGKVRGVNELLDGFTSLTNSLISNFTEQLTAISDIVDDQYNVRTFALYSRVGDVSRAIDAPPAYLEEIIQNARTFVLSVSSSMGLEYYDFLWAWDRTFQELLSLIGNSIPFYQANPQRIKTDVENQIIKPLYILRVNREKEKGRISKAVETVLVELKNLLFEHRTEIDENRQAVRDIPALIVEPAIKRIRDDWNFWLEGIYYPQQGNTLTALEIIRDRQREFAGNFADIIRRLGLAGDIIDGINFLPDDLRAEQLGKLVETVLSPVTSVVTVFKEQLIRQTEKQEAEKEELDLELETPEAEPAEIEIPVSIPAERSEITNLFYAGDF